VKRLTTQRPARAPAAPRAGVPRRLKLMISSRCDDPVPKAGGGVEPLSELRKRIKDELQREDFLGWTPFEVWINEDEPAPEGSRDAWDRCMEQASGADVVIALVNGNAGWSVADDDVGICHAELLRAYESAPAKVRIVRIAGAGPAGARHARFAEWLGRQNLWAAAAGKSDEMLAQVRAAAVDALGALAQAGVREGRRGKWHSGDALAWSRLDFARRGDEMDRVVRATIAGRPGSAERDGALVASIRGRDVLVRVAAVPGPMSVAPARERVGQPFLRDHMLAPLLRAAAGPVHVIACNRSVTESQATRMLGFPDVTLVTAPFGVYAADDVQKIQLLFLASCRDETSTRIAVQRAFEWLDASGEAERLVERAEQRARIVAAIAQENAPGGAAPTARRRRR
jgi:hypothetical protein